MPAMKNLIVFSFCFISLFSFAQNDIPTVEILTVVADDIAQELTVTYQLNDTENDDCDIWLKYSIDGGTYFETVSSEFVSGDVDAGVSPAVELTLVWNYAELGAEITDVHIQLYASDSQDVDIAEMVAQVDESELLSVLESVVGERHYSAAPAHLETVRSYISNAFETAGLQTESHDFTFSGNNMRNIIGRKPGAKAEDITFIVDGHFDGVPGSPAADDNGSAVAGVLEALRILSQYNFEHSIRFIGFDAEELGLVGSLRYVQTGIKPYEDIQGVLNFEMIGYYSDEENSQTLPAGFDFLFPEAAQEVADDDFRGNFLTVVGNVDSNPLLSAYLSASAEFVPELRLISLSVPGTGTMTPDFRRSDHARFWDADMEALMLTDAADFRNDNYHTPGDSIGTLNFEFMKNVVKATVATLAELAVPIHASSDSADLSIVLGIDEHHHNFPGEMSVFPNPSDGLVSIQISNAKQNFRARLEIFDLNGKQVHREILNFSSGASTAILDLQALPAGSYILILNAGEASRSSSLIIGN